MGKRGPLPQNVTPIRAEVGHRPAPSRARRARPVAPLAPEWLDRYGRRVWDRVVAELEPLGILNPSQRELLAAYCQAASVNFAAWKALTPNKTRGPDVLSAGRRDKDPVVKNPALSVLNQSARILDQLSRSLLTSPAALMRAELPDYVLTDESDLD